jgi:hypothetical protein
MFTKIENFLIRNEKVKLNVKINNTVELNAIMKGIAFTNVSLWLDVESKETVYGIVHIRCKYSEYQKIVKRLYNQFYILSYNKEIDLSELVVDYKNEAT